MKELMKAVSMNHASSKEHHSASKHLHRAEHQ